MFQWTVGANFKHSTRMIDPDEALVEARVKRYDIARLRLGQLFIPLAAIATVFARRDPGVVSVSAAFGLLALAFYGLSSAAKGYGWQPLRFEEGAMSVGATGLKLERFQIRKWTIVDTVARLYASDQSFELRVRDGAQVAVAALLQSVFGSPVRLARRGSTPAIVVSLVAAGFGLIVSGIAIARDDPRLLFGLPFFLFGLIAAGVLSQRIAR